MSDIHYFQRYSERENMVTNNTLLLFSRLYNASPQKFSSFLTELLELPENIVGARFKQQLRAHDKKGIPDGEVLQRSFRLLIETKLSADAFDIAQLRRHAGQFGDEEIKVLLLLSPDRIPEDKLSLIRLKALGKENSKKVFIQACSFNDVINKAREEVDPYDNELKAVIEDFNNFCADTGLLATRKSIMRVVPCGISLQENIKLSAYYAPSDRPYSPHSYLGVYNDKSVVGIGKITCIADIDMEKNGTLNVKKLIEGNLSEENKKNIKSFIEISPHQYGWEINRGHRFFLVDKFYPTDFRKESPGGIWGPRIFDLKNLLEFNEKILTEEIANGLRGQTWK